MQTTPIDALVVGGGPTGLTMAGELARRGLRVRLIDKATTPSPDHSRALGVQARTMEILDAMGLGDAEMSHGRMIAALNLITRSGKRARLPIRMSADLATPFPGMFVVQQFDTEAVLASRLPALGVAIERGVELTSYTQDASGVTATLRREGGALEQVRARWLLGCDGAHSPVRKGAGISFEGDTYNDHCLLGDVVVDWAFPDGELYICPSRKGIAAAFPVPGERRFRIILILPEAHHARSAELSLEEYEETLREIVPVPIKVEKAYVLSRYRLHHRVAARLRDGRAFLCGDAAHIHSPAGGQGMNTGIQDAYNLAWKIVAVERSEMPAWLLDTYEAERLPVARRLVAFTDRLFGFAAGGGTPGRVIRTLTPTLAVRAFSLPSVRRFATGFLSQLRIRYRKSPLSTQVGSAPEGGPLAGDRAPDGAIRDAEGKPARVFDALRHLSFTLLLFTGVRASEEAEAQAARLALRLRSNEMKVAVIGGKGAGAYEDPGGMTHLLYGAPTPAAVLVRPDGYIALRVDPLDEPALERELSRLFPAPAAPAARAAE
jgi:2-polyprenyl-6-methoxyphenol hydroxylase-like FAD-dependent oxidoreductase